MTAQNEKKHLSLAAIPKLNKTSQSLASTSKISAELQKALHSRDNKSHMDANKSHIAVPLQTVTYAESHLARLKLTVQTQQPHFVSSHLDIQPVLETSCHWKNDTIYFASTLARLKLKHRSPILSPCNQIYQSLGSIVFYCIYFVI